MDKLNSYEEKALKEQLKIVWTYNSNAIEGNTLKLFASIHPFFDGNGRLARLIANIPLLKSGFMPIIVNNEERQEYIELLSTYNLQAKALDKNSESLIEKNTEYQRLAQFFKEQYRYSIDLLDEIKESR